ncbi:recombinase family protein [Nocardioides dongxiaopingii]|uniref:recombinase family protein n=1 Tax=Nocardioides dongxiaopingii TaxID=2576036 RepID=UPI0014859E80|nr:recombinase family protein [Nocardioides dongxiaopingii]
MKTATRAGLLVRISDDREGQGAGVGRQQADAQALADRLGWPVVEIFTENDTSAYKRKRVTKADGTIEMRVDRPEFRRLLALIESGQIDGLVAYHLDRVARDPRDLEDLIDVVERARIPVESVTGSLRLATDSDITMARIGVAIANQSSRDASRRIRRKHEELATSGQFNGGGARRYGYERDGVTINEEEADVIRTCAGRVLAGESVSSICRDLDLQLILPVRAQRWSSRSLTDILRSPRIAGLRVHHGEVVGDAAWPAIVDRSTHEALMATLHARARGQNRPVLARWLNMLLWCGKCGHHLSSSSLGGDRAFRYWCNSQRDGCGGVAIQGPRTEAYVEAEVVGYLGRPDVIAALARGRSSDASQATRHDIEADEFQLRQLSRMWAERQITLDEYAEARGIIEQRIKSAKSSLLAVVPLHVRNVLASAEVGTTWTALTPAAKRDVARTVLGSQGLMGWTVAPATSGGPRRFDPSRLSLRQDGGVHDV